MSYIAALFTHRDPTPVRRITLGELSLAHGRKSEHGTAQPEPLPKREADKSSHAELTGASLKLCADPAVPFLATLAPVTLGGTAASAQPHQRLAPLYDTQPLASCVGIFSSGLGLASSCPS